MPFFSRKRWGEEAEFIVRDKLSDMGCKVWGLGQSKIKGQGGMMLTLASGTINTVSSPDGFQIINDVLKADGIDFDFKTLYNMLASPKLGVGVLKHEKGPIYVPVPDLLVSFCPHLVDLYGPFGLIDVKRPKESRFAQVKIYSKPFISYDKIGFVSPIPTFLLYYLDHTDEMIFQSVAVLRRTLTTRKLRKYSNLVDRSLFRKLV